MASQWQRHLLVMAGEGQEEAALALTPEAVVVAVAVLLALVLLVMLCACIKSDDSPIKCHWHRSSRKKVRVTMVSSGSTASRMPADPAALMIDILEAGDPTHNSATPGEKAPVGNGVTHGSKNGAPASSSHSRNESSGSGQMRPTSLRELPDLPVNSHKNSHSGAGAADKSASARNSAEEKGNNSAYDRLGAKISTSKAPEVNYDHINLESPHDFSSGTTPASEPDAVFEDHYAQVRERTYDVVKDVRARTSSTVASSADYDPYAKVKDVDDDKEDPYAKVKDTEKEDGDGDYAHLKEDHVIASPDVNASNAVVIHDDEDPYEKLTGDSGGGMVLAVANVIDPDDPYSVVSDQTSAAVIAHSSGTSPPAAASSTVGDRGSSSNKHNSATDHLRLRFADEGDHQGDYATVVKDRNPSTSREDRGSAEGGRSMEGEEEIEPYFTTPPEPPRLYEASEVGGAEGGAVEEASSRAESKERCYTKVTARESLASMTARNALNTYEIVPDLPENTYATVEGGSGDGVVRYATPGTPNLQHSTSRLSETYAEIGASGSGGYATPAPEPPSLDSLHSMTKSTSSNDGEHGGSRAPTSPSASSGNVVITEDGYAMVSKTSFSPSETALPQIPRASTSGSVGSLGSLGEEVTINGVTLHPDYHRVRDCIPDQDSENDPNYESVDEALSKVPASSAANSSSSPPSSSSAVMHAHSSAATGGTPCITIITHASSPSRKVHQYEEVSPPTSPTASDRAPAGTAGATSSNDASSNSASSSGAAPKAQHSDSGEAAEVRDRVLQGHMYEAISDVKKRNASASQKSDTDKKASGAIHSVKQ